MKKPKTYRGKGFIKKGSKKRRILPKFGEFTYLVDKKSTIIKTF